MTSEELTTLNDVFGALNNDSNENANNYDIIIRNQTSGNAMKVPVATFKTVLYNYLTSASVAASLASVLGGVLREIYANTSQVLTIRRNGTSGATITFTNNNGVIAALTAKHSTGKLQVSDMRDPENIKTADINFGCWTLQELATALSPYL